MKTFSIILPTMDMVKDFVNCIVRIEGKTTLYSAGYVMDAKSMMGVFRLDFTKPFQLEIKEWKEEYAPLLEKFIMDQSNLEMTLIP